MQSREFPLTIADLQQMKRAGPKIVGVVAWDYQIAQIVDRAGVDIISVGDSVGTNLWGRPSPLDVTMDEMVLVCRAVRYGVKRAIVSCDVPYGPLQQGIDSALEAATRLVKEAGADMIKLDGAADFPEAVRAITRAAAQNDYRFSSLVSGIVSSAPFQMRVKQLAEEHASVGTPRP